MQYADAMVFYLFSCFGVWPYPPWQRYLYHLYLLHKRSSKVCAPPESIFLKSVSITNNFYYEITNLGPLHCETEVCMLSYMRFGIFIKPVFKLCVYKAVQTRTKNANFVLNIYKIIPARPKRSL